MFDRQTDRQKRNLRRFQPTLSGSLCSGALEERFLTAPLFSRNGNFNATLLAGSSARASEGSDRQPFGTGSGFDNLYQVAASATASIGGSWQDGNGVTFAAANESGSVTAAVSGPGSTLLDDPNPDASAQIQINVQHSGKDSFSNNTANPLDPTLLVNGANEDSRTTSGNQGGNTLGYVTSGDSTVTATFQATISATGTVDKFTAGASLTLSSTFLSVTVGQGTGLVATDGNGNVVLRDANFESQLPYSAAQKVTVTVPNVPGGTNLGIAYDSSVSSHVGGEVGMVVGGQPGAGDGKFPTGTTTNNITFNWSLTYNIS